MSLLYRRSVTVGQFFAVCAFCAIYFSLEMLGSQAWAQTLEPLGGDDKRTPPADVRPGRPGGVALSDFSPLIDLIQGTIDTELWSEGGGQASIQPYVQGIFADAQGALRFVPATKSKRDKKASKDLRDDSSANSKFETQPPVAAGDVRIASDLRFISLPRLESALAGYLKQRKALPPEVLTLAGLQRIQFVLVVPATDQQPGDLILAGPAGDWRTDDNGIIVSQDHGQPVVRIDDLLTLWRRSNPTEPFGVTINPTEAGLAQMQNYLATSTTKPIKKRKRDEWVNGIRESVGKQNVQFFNLKPDSHVAKILLTADYHMKCIGCLLYTSPSPRDLSTSRMPSSA